MAFDVPKLKYSEDALAPYLSRDLVHYHYEKHTKKYFETMNKLIKGTTFENSKTLDDIIDPRGNLKKGTKLYNNVMQAYNHSLYWENLAPHKDSGEPSDILLEEIEKQWSSFEKFKKEFQDAGAGGFGSTWCWLVLNDKKLEIVVTNNADNPVSQDQGKILLVVDGWEHSWYVQYFNDKAAYFEAIWNIVNWKIINERFTGTRKDAK